MCTFCKCKETVSSSTAHVISRNDRIIIIRNVPCVECTLCGEKSYSSEIVKKLDTIVSDACKIIQEVAVIDYNKSA